MSKPLNVGIIGYGFMGRAHSNAYAKVNHFFDLQHVPHRNFKVLRLKSARRIAMIQSRTTTFGSSHPFISK